MAELEKGKRGPLLAVLFAGVLMGALDISIIGPAMPAMQASFGIGERSMTWLFSIYILFNVIGTPLLAKLSDRFGRRALFSSSVVLFGLGSIGVALSPSFGFLLAARAVQGFGAGGIFPVASAVVGESFPAEKRGSVLGLIGAVWANFLVKPVQVLFMYSESRKVFDYRFNRWKLVYLPVIFIVAVLVSESMVTNAWRPVAEAGQFVLAVTMVLLAYRNELIPLIRQRFHR